VAGLLIAISDLVPWASKLEAAIVLITAESGIALNGMQPDTSSEAGSSDGLAVFETSCGTSEEDEGVSTVSNEPLG
jgi:hypothetical protein